MREGGGGGGQPERHENAGAAYDPSPRLDRFASLLENQVGHDAVHLEMPINDRMRSDLDPLPPEKKRRTTTFIDIVVTDLSELTRPPPTAEGAGAAFRARQHEAFIEVKWFPRAAPRWDWHDYARCAEEVPADLERLHLHRVAGRCLAAAMLVVDDRGTFMPRLLAETNVPDDVLLLVLAPPT